MSHLILEQFGILIEIQEDCTIQEIQDKIVEVICESLPSYLPDKSTEVIEEIRK